jgi:hypothetical protein
MPSSLPIALGAILVVTLSQHARLPPARPESLGGPISNVAASGPAALFFIV